MGKRVRTGVRTSADLYAFFFFFDGRAHTWRRRHILPRSVCSIKQVSVILHLLFVCTLCIGTHTHTYTHLTGCINSYHAGRLTTDLPLMFFKIEWQPHLDLPWLHCNSVCTQGSHQMDHAGQSKQYFVLVCCVVITAGFGFPVDSHCHI